jgi:uncharacterized protein YqjF (DUF2071 family)
MSPEPFERGPRPNVTIANPVMRMHWDTLTFLHWRYDPAMIDRLLPRGLVAQTFDGTAWVSLVPFVMRITAPGLPVVPWIGRFCETNVRTYVTAEDGTEGIWFFSLDAARLAAVATARATFGLPYIWSTMAARIEPDRATYVCRRVLGGATSRVSVRIGESVAADELSQLDHFLSARWRLYAHHLGANRYALARHEPWPLRRAELLELDDHLIVADGLPAPEGDPIVQYAETVAVDVSRPYSLRHAGP